MVETKENIYIRVLLNDFLFNAGVVGLLRVFQYADDVGVDDDGKRIECREGKQYIIDGQTLYISVSFLQNNNIADLFIRTAVKDMGNDTKFVRVMEQKSLLDAYYEDFDEKKAEDKAWKKKTDEIFKSFTDMLLKKSYISGYQIYNGENTPEVSDIETLKKEKDYAIKKKRYNELHQKLQDKDLQHILKFKDLMYSDFNMFYADNKGNGPAFFSQRDIDPAKAYEKRFVVPLREHIEKVIEDDETLPDALSVKDKDILVLSDTIKNGKESDLNCIQCGKTISGYTKAQIARISDFVDTADDLAKKTSYYWNCNADAYLCPVCSFICSLAPLGFQYYGSEAVFINSSSDIPTLMAFKSSLSERYIEEKEKKETAWYRINNSFSSQKFQASTNRLENIQVIIRNRDNAKYSFSVVSKKALEILRDRKDNLEKLRNMYVKDGEIYHNIYQLTVSNVLNQRNQFPLIEKVIRISLENELQTEYLYGILCIHIHQKGGSDMEGKIKRAYAAKMSGSELRRILTADVSLEKDKDNKLRGLVYQLLNAVSMGNRDRFLELIIRSYSGCGMPVPDFFFSCFQDSETFKEIGYAYILGMKSGYSKEKENA